MLLSFLVLLLGLLRFLLTQHLLLLVLSLFLDRDNYNNCIVIRGHNGSSISAIAACARTFRGNVVILDIRELLLPSLLLVSFLPGLSKLVLPFFAFLIASVLVIFFTFTVHQLVHQSILN